MTLQEPASQDAEASAPAGAGMLALAELIGHARQQSEEWMAGDPTYAELMGTYAELGELLASEDAAPWFDSDCRGLVDRLIALGRRIDAEVAQELAAVFARQQAGRRAA